MLNRFLGRRWAKSAKSSRTSLNVLSLEGRTVPAISYSVPGSNYVQNFDGLPPSGTFTFTGDNAAAQSPATTAVPGAARDLTAAPGALVTSGVGASTTTGTQPIGVGDWYFQRVGNLSTAAQTTRFIVDAGTSATGAAYSYGSSTTSTDRALGLLASGSGIERIGAVFVNNSTTTLTSFNLSFAAEQWRHGAVNNTANTLTFNYKIGATGIDDTAGFNSASQLNAVSTLASSSASGPLDGNSPLNRTLVTGTVGGISWAPGQTLVIRWSDVDDPGSDDGIAIDDLTFTAAATGGPSIFYVDPSFTGANGSSVTDADPITAGNQSATIGTTAFPSITAALAASSAGQSITLNPGSYAEAVNVNVAVTLKVQGAVTVTSLDDSISDATLALANGTLTFGNATTNTTFDSKITGSGGLVKVGASTATFAGANDFTGTLAINGGVLLPVQTSSFGASPAVSVGTGATVSLNGLASLSFGGLTGTGTVAAGAGTNKLFVSFNGTNTFAGTLSDGSAGGVLQLNRTLTGTLILTGTSNYTGGSTIGAGGTLQLDGAINGGTSALNIFGGGFLAGTGSYTGLYSAGGTTYPGTNGTVGTLSVGDLVNFPGSGTVTTSNAVLAIDILGPTSSDQLVVNSAILNSGKLSINLGPTYTPAAGTVFTIVNNTGGSGILGTFVNAPEGATVNAVVGTTSVPFTISYVGGDGNDITLTSAAVADTTAPTATATASNITTRNGTSAGFTVTYSDNVAVNVTTLSSATVTVTGPNGSTTATLGTITPSGNGPALVANYTFTAPGGTFDVQDNGAYTISLSGTVTDTSSNPIATGAIGSFNVAAPVAVTAVYAKRPDGTELLLGAQPGPISYSVTGFRVVYDGVATNADQISSYTLATTGGVTQSFTASASTVGNHTEAVLTKRLANGRYNLTLLGAQIGTAGTAGFVGLDGDNDGAAGGNAKYEFARYYGDANNSGAVDAQDVTLFLNTYGTSIGNSAYNPVLDYDGSGAVDAQDVTEFLNSYGTTAP